jgi:5-(carboxyamino)imidazole ribonucleotide synthase
MKPSFFSSSRKLGILGGGQLGKMLLYYTRRWDIYTSVLDPDPDAPARLACNEFTQGSLLDYQTVYEFGKQCDVLTIEIEHVNVEALQQLKSEGVIVHPDPKALDIINDKGLQKMFFKAHHLPTSDFTFYDNKEAILTAIDQGDLTYPFVQKSRKGGYDGRGVHIVRQAGDLEGLIEAPSLVEDLVRVKQEIAIIAARNSEGQVICYDAVSMEFIEGANMLDLLAYPVQLDSLILAKAKQIASTLIELLDICGLLAVEFFINQHDHVFINEVAPRPHNSGHQTIESSETSQYEQHLRGILNLPLGSTRVHIPSVMVNLLGAEGYSGDVIYENMDTCLEHEGIHVHIYGKKKTKPFRKMGHVTVTNNSLEEAKKMAQWVKETILVRSQS